MTCMFTGFGETRTVLHWSISTRTRDNSVARVTNHIGRKCNVYRRRTTLANANTKVNIMGCGRRSMHRSAMMYATTRIAVALVLPALGHSLVASTDRPTSFLRLHSSGSHSRPTFCSRCTVRRPLDGAASARARVLYGAPDQRRGRDSSRTVRVRWDRGIYESFPQRIGPVDAGDVIMGQRGSIAPVRLSLSR